jgi:pyruvate-ferredoxin/flavodoxin oxidoreductase
MTGRELDGLSRLLTCDLPVKVILLDGCDLRECSADPLLLALAHRHAFVMAASVAHHDHFFRGMTEALSFVGPALIKIHAPSPGRHGFAVDGTIERARSAVTSRVHPLVLYNPCTEGVFGSRLSLDGNPMVDREWATTPDGQQMTPELWAAGETRFTEYSKISSDERGLANSIVPGPNGASLAVGEILLKASRERGERWTTLQELCGVVTPFTESVRRRLEQEMRDGHEAELAALREEYEGKLAEMERGQSAAQAAKLRERLLQLAGYGKGKE